MQAAVTIRNGRKQCHFHNIHSVGAWWPWLLTLITLNMQSDYNTLGCACGWFISCMVLQDFISLVKLLHYVKIIVLVSVETLGSHSDRRSKRIGWTLNVVSINQHCRVSWVDMIYLLSEAQYLKLVSLDYRSFIWRCLLCLPENHTAYSSLLERGTHPAYLQLHQHYPIKSRKLLRVLQR